MTLLESLLYELILQIWLTHWCLNEIAVSLQTVYFQMYFHEKKNFYLILQHHVENTKIKQLLRKNWTILGSSDLTSSLFQSRLICGASRNPRLRDMLVRSSLPLNPQFGKTGKSKNICTNTSCKYCHSLDTTGQIRSNKLGRNFPSKHSVCCKSHNLVYCLTCNICGLQYVGQTKRTFHLRLYEHFRDI